MWDATVSSALHQQARTVCQTQKEELRACVALNKALQSQSSSRQLVTFISANIPGPADKTGCSLSKQLPRSRSLSAPRYQPQEDSVGFPDPNKDSALL